MNCDLQCEKCKVLTQTDRHGDHYNTPSAILPRGKKGENSDQKIIGPLSQGHVRFKLSVQILKGDVFEGHPGPKKFEMMKMGLKNRFT